MHKASIFLVLVMFLLSSCASNKIIIKRYATKNKNITYGAHKKQKLDLCKPKIENLKPIVVLIHGGSWVRGGKYMLSNVEKMLNKQGYTTINMNYRLVNKHRSNVEQLQDVGLAINLVDSLLGKINEYVLLGESAGGQIAYLFGYQHPQKVKAIISLSGPTDFTDRSFIKSFKKTLAIPLLNKVTGSKFNQSAEALDDYKKFSPIYQISNVPTLLIHGKLDYLVNVRQGYAMEKMLAKKNVDHRLITISIAGHVGRLNPIIRDKIIYPGILQFLNSRF